MTPEAIECESRIERVVVYSRGAVVTRRVSIPEDLPEGTVEVAIRGITVVAEPGSARALTEGERDVVGLRVKRVVPASPSSPGELAARVREHHLARARLKNERAHVRARRDLLASVSLDPGMAKAWRRVNPSVRIADALALSALLTQELEALDARVVEMDEALEKNRREREAAELAAAQGRTAEVQGDSRPSLEVIVRLSPGGAVRSLAIEYVVWPARWVPSYSARFSAAATRVAWTIEALIAQASGEDWSHVALSLSTADLVHDARLPELPSLRLGRAQPPARRGYRSPPEGLDAMFEGYDRFVASLPTVPPPYAGPRRSILPPAPMAMAGLVDSMTTVRTPSELEAGLFEDDALEVESTSLEERPDRMTLPSADTIVQLPFSPAYRGSPTAAAATAAPQPLPRNTPVPQAMPLPASKPQGGFASSESKTPMREQARKPLEEGSTMDAPAQLGGAGSAQAAWEPAAPQAIEPADAWLDFDALYLAEPASKASRGRLARDDPQAGGGPGRAAYELIEHLALPAYARDPRDSRGQFDHRYDAEALGDVPSNARLHRVTVAAANAPATPRFITVPRESAEIYREVEIRNPFDAPLLSGPVEVFVDGALLTQSTITHVDRGGAILLGLGVEDRLRVARNARVEEGSAGLLGGSTAIEHVVTIELASALGRDVEVSVIDRIPITDDRDVEIKTLFVRPAAEPYTQADRGQPVRKGLRWHVTVPAGGKSRIELGYKVVLSSKSEIVGGNRRE